jgi:hypothetical protein
MIISTLSGVIAATALLASCTRSDDPVRLTVAASPVAFTLGFTSSDGQAELFDHESRFAGVTVAAFTKGGSFHSSFAPAREGDHYVFDMEEGNYKIWVLANAHSAQTIAELLTPGVSRESDLLALTTDGALARDRRLPMVSASAIEFYRDPQRRTSLGQIEMKRMAARIDVVNGVDGLTIDRVVMRSRAAVGTLDHQTVPQGSAHLEDKAFNDLGLEGSADQPALFTGHLYSYANHNASGEGAASVVVHYTYLDERHSTEFAFDGRLDHNHLYSVQLVHRGGQIDHRAASWSHGGMAVEYFSPLALPNRRLAINRFAPTNVETLNEAKGLVTFCADNSTAGYATAWSADFAGTTYSDAAGNSYRVPTPDEMRLVAPDIRGMLSTASEGEALNVEEILPNLFGVSGSGGQGLSDYWMVRTGESGDVPAHTIYATRFRNTLQAAAYRYRFDDQTRFSIRVKAIGMTPPTKEQVCDEAYWAEDYIELVFPVGGTRSTLWTDAKDERYPIDQALALILSNSEIAVTNANMSVRGNLRLVRAE